MDRELAVKLTKRAQNETNYTIQWYKNKNVGLQVKKRNYKKILQSV